VADYNIGDDVPFELIGTTPTTIGDFSTYKYIFHDTLSKGLTYNEGTLKVTMGTDDVTDQFKTTYDQEKNTLTIADNDITKINGLTKNSIFKVNYTAKLNANAEIGLPGNENTVALEYSNNPTKDGTGFTPDDHVIVFTYELDTKKVDGNTGAALKDAKFKLYRMNGETKEYCKITDGKVSAWNETGTELVSNQDGLFTVAGLDDGTYYLEETQAPNGYNKLTEPVKVFITAETANNQKWDGTPANALTKLTLTINDQKQEGDLEKGVVNATVSNTSDVKLPETGSRGTTAFLTAGLAFIAAAFVYMFRKRQE
jgi:fimbrial isopeptide formation D2 family protein/LPXTG-motif cell wall-anchored protein